MRLAPPNDNPKLTVMGGTTVAYADGTVEATSPIDVVSLLAAGWVATLPALSEVEFPGRLRFELAEQSGLIPVAFSGAY